MASNTIWEILIAKSLTFTASIVSEGFLSPHLAQLWLLKQIPSPLMATFNPASGQNAGTDWCITCALPHTHTALFSFPNHHIPAKVCSDFFCTLDTSLALHIWHFPTHTSTNSPRPKIIKMPPLCSLWLPIIHLWGVHAKGKNLWNSLPNEVADAKDLSGLMGEIHGG